MKPEIFWVFAALVIFAIIPKKYPRLLLGLLPYIAVLIAVELKFWSVFQRQGVLAASALWLTLGSVFTLPVNILRKKTDDSCPQIWLRPVGDDLGLRKAAQWIEEVNVGPVYVLEEGIPCELQTTHPFSYHLKLYLNRRGFEHEIVSVASEEDITLATMVIKWSPQGVELIRTSQSK